MAGMLDRMGPYGAYLMGQQFQQEQDTSKINNMNALAQLAKSQQDFNYNTDTRDIRIGKDQAALDKLKLENSGLEFEKDVRDSLGVDFAANAKRGEVGKANAEKYTRLGTIAAQLAPVIQNMPSHLRIGTTKAILSNAGFTELVEGIEQGDPNKIPSVLQSIATESARLSQEGQLQGERLRTTVSENAKDRTLKQRLANQSESGAMERARLAANTNITTAGMAQAGQDRRQALDHAHAIDVIDKNASVMQQKMAADFYQDLTKMGVKQQYDKENIALRGQIEKELKAGEIAAASLARVEDAQNRLMLMGVDHKNRLAEVNTEYQLRTELERSKEKFKATEPKKYDEFTKWINTTTEIFQKQNPNATETDILVEQSQRMAEYFEFKRAKPEGVQIDMGALLKDGVLQEVNRNPKLSAPGTTVAIGGTTYTKEQYIEEAKRRGTPQEKIDEFVSKNWGK